MIGSEKQIAWAEDIKNNAYGALDCMDRNIDNELGCGHAYKGVTHEMVSLIRAQLDEIFAKTEKASDIINNRNLFTQNRFLEIVGAMVRGEINE